MDELWRAGISPGQVLIAGDELGMLGGVPGSDSLLLVGRGAQATAVSVGAEPAGVPAGVIALGGGPRMFAAVLEDQIARRREVPTIEPDPAWTLVFDGVDPLLERVRESLLTLADGRLATRGSVLVTSLADMPSVLHAGVYVGSGPETELLAGPRWNRVTFELAETPTVRRVLDLHTGLMRQELQSGDARLEALLLSSLALPATTAVRIRDRGFAIPMQRGLQPPGGRRGRSGALWRSPMCLDPTSRRSAIVTPDPSAMLRSSTLRRRRASLFVAPSTAHPRTDLRGLMSDSVAVAYCKVVANRRQAPRDENSARPGELAADPARLEPIVSASRPVTATRAGLASGSVRSMAGAE